MKSITPVDQFKCDVVPGDADVALYKCVLVLDRRPLELVMSFYQDRLSKMMMVVTNQHCLNELLSFDSAPCTKVNTR